MSAKPVVASRRSSRAMAIVHSAIFDVVNAATGGRYESYTGIQPPRGATSLDAAVSQVRQQERMVQLRRDVIEGQVSQARSQAEASRVAAERVREGSRPQEIRVAEAELSQAEAILTQRRSDYDRISGLVKEGVVPKAQLDVAEAALRTAESSRDAASQRLALSKEGARRQDIAEAQAQAEKAQAGVNVAEAGRREVDVQIAALASAQATEKQLRAQLETAKTQLSYTEIRSPMNGVVLTKNVEPGEFVNPGDSDGTGETWTGGTRQRGLVSEGNVQGENHVCVV